jgi:hypothetical protein
MSDNKWNWKEYYSSITIDWSRETKDRMAALTRKELDSITREAYRAGGGVIPTMTDDPDFGDQSAIIKGGSMKGGSMVQPMHSGVCDTMGCRFAPEKSYGYCKPCLTDRKYIDKWGKKSPHHRKHITMPPGDFGHVVEDEAMRQGVAEEEVKSLAEGTILMMETTGDDWSAALDILYDKEDDE